MRTIRDITQADVDTCAALLIDAYNREPWNDHWTMEIATRFLREFLQVERFKGFLMEEGGQAVGAAFCHSRTWWTADELFVDEFYIASSQQRKGLGGELMTAIEAYTKAMGLAGVTLLTNRFYPAMEFYKKHGFEVAGHVVFLYKTV